MGGVSVKVEIVGLAELSQKITRMAAKTPDELTKALNMGALAVSSTAKSTVPVDTGALRNSIHATPAVKKGNDVVATVGTSIEYAPYVEFGTGVLGEATNDNPEVKVSYASDWAGQIAQPFLFPALRTNKDKINRLVAQAVIKAVRNNND